MMDETYDRRLVAILIADIVEYSRLMGEDETGTLRAMQGHRFALIDPTIGQHKGRVVKRMGDGVLVVFLISTASLDNPENYPPTYHLGIESMMPCRVNVAKIHPA